MATRNAWYTARMHGEREMTQEEREEAFRELDAICEVLTEQEYSCALLEHDILELKGIHWQAALTADTQLLGEKERREREEYANEIDEGIAALEKRLAAAQGSVATFRARVEKVRESLTAQRELVVSAQVY